MKKLAGVVTALTATGVMAGVVLPPTATAAPVFDHSATTYTDCNGPAWCTEYWSVEETEQMQESAHSLAWNAILGLIESQPIIAVFEQNNIQQYAAMTSAADSAVNNFGCLQARVRKDGKGTVEWSYTTDGDWCWHQAPTSIEDSSGTTYTFDGDSNTYVPSF